MAEVARHPLPGAITVFVSLFWAGMLAGVSFLATPVKFEAASLDLPVALEVGKVTFALFTRFEWALSFLLAISVLSGGFRKIETACAAGAILLVLIQALWLLPVLDVRIDAIVAGVPLPPARHHLFYAVSEGLKLVLLCAIALTAVFRLGWQPRRDIVAAE